MTVAGEEGLQILGAVALGARLQRLFARGLADAVDDLVLENSDQPGADGRLTRKPRGALERREQGVLHGVLRGAALAQLQKRETQQVGAMPLQFKRARSRRLGRHEHGCREGRPIYRLRLGIASALEIGVRGPQLLRHGRYARTHSKGRNMANITRYDPFGDLVDDFFRGFVVRPAGFEAQVPVRRMKVDVAEQNGEYKVVAELPGVRKEDIKVNIDGDEVSISAETRVEKEAKDGERLLHSERYVGKVSRAFRLAQEIDESRASAKYSDGVLELTLPKKAAAAAKQLAIQ